MAKTTVSSSFELHIPPNGQRITAKQKTCGMEWEAEAVLTEYALEISMWCNRHVEGDIWCCFALVGVLSSDGIDLLGYNGCEWLFFNGCTRQHSFSIPRSHIGGSQQGITITYKIRDVIGYREPEAFAADFFNPSALSDLCVTFRNTGRRLYVNSQFLSIHSTYFAGLFTKAKQGQGRCELNEYDHPGTPDSMSDFDVVTAKSDDTAVSGNSEVYSRQMDVECMSQNDYPVFILENVDIEDFLVFLRTVYPPNMKISEKTVPALLSASYNLGADHILRDCEEYLLSEKGVSSFDLLTRLEFATLYKMASLQTDCLRRLRTARCVSRALHDPRMETLPKEIRSILLKTLLQRFTKDDHAAKSATEVPVGDTPVPIVDMSGGSSLEKKRSTRDEVSGCSTSRPPTPPLRDYVQKSVNAKEGNADRESLEMIELRRQLKRETAMRQILELSLKSMREFIQNSATTVKPSPDDADPAAHLSQLEARIAALETSTVNSAPPAAATRMEPHKRDYIEELVFDTFDATKLDRDMSICCNNKRYSMHGIFHDIVLEPYASMKYITYSVISHFFFKCYGESIVPLLRAHRSKKVNALPAELVEQIVSSIIDGFHLKSQLLNDAFLIHELEVKLRNQVFMDFDDLCSNMMAVTFTV